MEAMTPERPHPALLALRAEIKGIETGGRASREVLPFGLDAMDRRLPGGGLALGALHEVLGGGADAVHGAASSLFAAGVAARTQGSVLWCLARAHLFAPSLAQAGLSPDRVIYVEAGADEGVLECFEEGLRHGGLGAVVGEVSRLTMTASRRLQLACEGSGTLGIALRRWRKPSDAARFDQPTASVTRWRVSALPSSPLPSPGVGRARWQVELIRCRAGAPAQFHLEACDETGRLALPADLADGSVPQTPRAVRAVS